MAIGIEQIHTPLSRSLRGAWIGFSAATLISAVTLGFLGRDDAQTLRRIGSMAGVGAVAGAIAGAILKPQFAASLEKEKPAFQAQTAWINWRHFVVVRKVRESAEITSFYLKPQDGGSLPSFKPGQFLTIRLDIPGQPRPVIRTYSLSDYCDPVEHYRLSIKREPTPQGLTVPPGLASNYLHDQVQEGAVIAAKPPGGRFVLDAEQSRPVVLISNGVGITPMISMVKAVARLNPRRHIWFLHGARNGEFHALRDEMATVAASFPHLHLYYRYSRPLPADAGMYHSQGYIDAMWIEQVIIPAIQSFHASGDADYFLCGSPSFMDSLREGLRSLGVPDSQVFFESFSKPKAAIPDTAGPRAMEVTTNATAASSTSAEVTFARTGKTAIWKPEDGTLLEFAERQGLNPDYSCRQGICLTCTCRIEEGEVEYEQPPTGIPDAGDVLICISKPKSPRMVLDL